MAQKFHADANTRRRHPNGAESFAPGGPFDIIGHHWAKVRACPVECDKAPAAHGLRLTCYATGTADTFFSVPACTRYKGQHIGGYFTTGENGPVFRVSDRYAPKLQALALGQSAAPVPSLAEHRKTLQNKGA